MKELLVVRVGESGKIKPAANQEVIELEDKDYVLAKSIQELKTAVDVLATRMLR